MMSNPAIRTIVIAGGGTAGWMAAAALARFCGPGWRIQLVESDAIGTVGVGEATIPQIRLFNAGLGIDEADFLSATQGTLKLGIEFVDWWQPGHRYMHNFGEVGRALGVVPFHHWWAAARAAGVAADYGHYSLNERAARAGRFAPFGGDNTLPPLVWAYHFDAGLYAAYLRRFAEARGVTRHEGRIARVETAGDTILALHMDDGRRIAGDLFVDCSGFRSLLLGETLGSGWHDWSHWLPCDSAVAVPCAHAPGAELTPCTRSTARAAGWQWRIPLQHRIGNGHVFSSAFMAEDEAAAILMANLDGPALAEPRLLKFTTGRRAAAWSHNVVAIGLSAGFMEPLESTSLHLVQSGLMRLLALWPTAAMEPLVRDEYNRVTVTEWERIRDFLILHYHLNSRPEPLWRHCAAMTIPDTLAHRIAHFRHSGRLVSDGPELFLNASWLAVHVGQFNHAQGYDPLADARAPQVDAPRLLAGLARVMREAAAEMPSHAAFIARHCAANQNRVGS